MTRTTQFVYICNFGWGLTICKLIGYDLYCMKYPVYPNFYISSYFRRNYQKSKLIIFGSPCYFSARFFSQIENRLAYRLSVLTLLNLISEQKKLKNQDFIFTFSKSFLDFQICILIWTCRKTKTLTFKIIFKQVTSCKWKLNYVCVNFF